MFWPDYSSFYERKTAHSDAVLSLKAQKKSAGDICFGLSYTQNSLYAQLMRNSEQRVSE